MADRRDGGSRRMKTVRDVSAGGVVFRRGPEGLEVALVGRLDPEVWALPKGMPARGESLEQAAQREATEETGLHVRLICPLLDIDYWFVWRGVRHHKTVHFYLMEEIGGDTALHDAEYDVVEWFPLAEAERRLSFANERNVLARAEATRARPECLVPNARSPHEVPGTGDREL
jgi:8-oxo-dGTP pyrophosphatase MutT (NUDIX family)